MPWRGLAELCRTALAQAPGPRFNGLGVTPIGRREKRTGLALPFHLVFVTFGREGVNVLME